MSRLIAPPSEFPRHVAHVLPATLAILLETAPHDMLEHRLRRLKSRRRRFAAGNCRDDGQWRLAVERFTPGQHFVQDTAERKNVGAVISGIAIELLWRHVG